MHLKARICCAAKIAFIVMAALWHFGGSNGHFAFAQGVRSDEGKAGGGIQGRLLAVDGKPSRTPSVFVFVCEADGGRPLSATTRQAIGVQGDFAGMEGWLHGITDNQGEFLISELPEGKYRLVAQSWPGRNTIPTQKDDDSALMLHGFANDVEVKVGAISKTSIRAFGMGMLNVQNTPDECNAYVFLALKPALGEPVLGPYFWGDEYIQNIAGATHMKRGSQQFFGLPENSDVHLMLLNYDNNMGVGGVIAKAGGPMTVARLPIYATWSNGYYKAPERLQPVVDWIQNHKTEALDLLTDGNSQQFLTDRNHRDFVKLADYVKLNHNRMVDVGGVGEVSLIDVLAAESYLRFQESHEARVKAMATSLPVNRVPLNRLLVIGIDGCRPDAIAAAKTPNLDALIKAGAYSDTTKILGDRYRKNDTVSGPGWSSFLTGVWADKHGVQDNQFEGRNYGLYPHFFKRIKQQFPDARTGSFVNWEPIDKYIVESADVRVVYPSKGAEGYAENDILLAKEASQFLINGEPHVAMVYFGAVDETGHKYGFHPSVPEYIHAIETVDEHVGTVVEAMKGRSEFASENWLVLVSTDHGGKDKGHGGGHDVPEILTTFLIVSGRDSARGAIDRPTYVVDLPVTGLTHLGVTIDPKWKLDGTPVGLSQTHEKVPK